MVFYENTHAKNLLKMKASLEDLFFDKETKQGITEFSSLSTEVWFCPGFWKIKNTRQNRPLPYRAKA